MTRTLAPSLVLLLALFGGALSAQPSAARERSIRVRVVDSAGVAVPDAELELTHGLGAPITRGTTDSAGVRTFVIALKPGEYAVTARKLGHRRADRLFSLDSASALTLALVSPRVTQQLAQVTVSADRDSKRRLLSIDADAIAANASKVHDAADIIGRLRPDMIYGLGGPYLPRCEPLSRIWVNGKWIRLPAINPAFAQERSQAIESRQVARVRFPNRMGGRPAQPARGRAAIPLDVGSVLVSIKPEHIAEMTYHDCNDFSMNVAGGTSALFVVLKDGVKYSPDVGSYLANDNLLAALKLAEPTKPAPEPAPISRLLGVFDLESGDPIAGVDVIDVASGWHVATTPTGTVSLGFLGAGEHRVRLQRSGYRADSLTVKISPVDSTPITALLAKAAAGTP